MSIKINSFGGPFIWFFRKYFSNITSRIALSFAAVHYNKNIKDYIDYFDMEEKLGKLPIFFNVMVETENRCNGTCSFCPAGKDTETRPFKRMNEELYYKIINELSEIKWKGHLYLSVNNEPFIDKRISDFAKYAKNNLSDVYVELITNGTLLSAKKMYDLIDRFDRITINDYSDRYSLSEPHRSIYREVKSHERAFSNIEIIINRRFNKEILSTRAGYAPNKKRKNNNISSPCIYPFMDIVIFPDGQIGMCCNDCAEISAFGNANHNRLLEIWNNERFDKLRVAMKTGDRRNYPFCKECDVFDAGGREIQIRDFLRKENNI